MNDDNHWAPFDNESIWVEIGSILGMIVIPILLWLTLAAGLIYILWICL